MAGVFIIYINVLYRNGAYKTAITLEFLNISSELASIILINYTL